MGKLWDPELPGHCTDQVGNVNCECSVDHLVGLGGLVIADSAGAEVAVEEGAGDRCDGCVWSGVRSRVLVCLPCPPFPLFDISNS